MLFRYMSFAAILAIASCGNAEVTIEDRIRDAEKNCTYLASEAALETAGLGAEQYCECMVTVLEGWPEPRAEAVSHTLVYMSKHTAEDELGFQDLAKKIKSEAKAPDAPGSAVSLGIGVGFVDDLIGTVNTRATNDNC